MNSRLSTHRYATVLTAALLTWTLAAPAFSQTHIVAPPNRYAPSDDVKLGQQAAAQARKQKDRASRHRIFLRLAIPQRCLCQGWHVRHMGFRLIS